MRHMPHMVAVMTPFPRHIETSTPLATAAALMQEQHIRHLPVTEDGDLIGIISHRDLERARTPGHPLASETELTAGDLCTHRPYCVDVGDPLDRVLDAIVDKHLGAVLVLKEGELVGIFSAVDACHLLSELLRERFHPDPGFDAA